MTTANPTPLPAPPDPNVPATGRPNEPADLADDLRMYRLVRRIRSFEESLVTLFGDGKVYGTAHTCVGQEAVAVGALFDLTDDDFVTGTHRSHGHCIAKGADVGLMMAELLGRENGYCGGKGGSMHIADLDLNMLGCNGLVSAGVPHAAGAVMAAGLRGERRVAVAFHGDGAANQGILYETLNLAAVWKLPIIVICENNQYAMTTPYAISQAGENIAARAAGFGIPAEVVDGMDVHAVRAAVGAAIERGRAGEGPSYIECQTYRYMGHSLRNDRPVRSEEEIASWRARDPLPALARRLNEHHGLPESETAAIDDEEQGGIEAAVAAAEASPEPGPEMLTAGVFCDDPWEETPPPRTEADENRILSYAGALNEAHHQAMAADERILLFGEDVAEGGGVFGVSTGLKERFGAERVRDTPISEQAITGLGVGLALADARPIVEIQFMDILILAADQIVNQAAKIRYMLGGRPRVPLVVRAPLGAGVKLAAQHSQSLETWFMHVPGLIVAAPSTPYDAKGLLMSALRSPNPVVFLEHKLLYFLSGPVPEEVYTLPLGVAEVQSRGHRRHRRRDVRDGAKGDAGGAAAASREGVGGGHRSADARPARRRDHRGVGAQDGAPRGRPRGVQVRRLRGRDRRRGDRASLRRAESAPAAGRRPLDPGTLQLRARAALHSGGAADHRGHPQDPGVSDAGARGRQGSVSGR